mgnify:CR=1 FL=1
MAATFPPTLKTFTNPVSTDKLNSPAHATQHTGENDEIIAIETYLGTNDSQTTPVAAGKVLNSTSASAATWTATPTLGVAGTTLGQVLFSGNTSGTTTLQPAAAASGTITLPAATDTLVGKATTDTLTNKTLTSPTLTTPALGTPASGVLTNCTGLPAASVLAGSLGAGAFVVSTSLQAATIELGAATDTTLSRVSAGLIAVEGVTVADVSTAQTLTNKTLTSPTLTTPALGTPASGVLTNCTGLPAASVLAGSLGAGAFVVSTSLQAATIELGAATDTTLSRVSAGLIAVEGVTVQDISTAQTITNKRIEPRIVSAASYTTDTGTSLSVATTDIFVITAQAGALLFNNPGGTAVQGQRLVIRIKDNATARALTWGSEFRAMGTALPTTTTLSKTMYMGFFYNSTDTKWDMVALATEA